MPIKFRCSYCRQFLGISREKAGELVDCPTCGRTIRVPGLDGRVQPLPKPELDRDDPLLADALSELAALGTDGPVRTEPAEAAAAIAEPETLTPQPLPEPVPIELPLPPEPIAASSINVLPQSIENSSLATADFEQELASLATLAPASERVSAAQIHRTRRSNRSWLFLGCAGLCAGTFGLGFLAGRWTAPDREKIPLPTVAAPRVVAEDIPAASMEGRITYKTDTGDSRPDRGARVIVFPIDAVVNEKLSVVGFRPADGESEFRSALSRLEKLGGTAATVEEDGSYRLNLSAAGTYPVLVISRYESRDETEPIDANLLKLLNQYFERPEELLGRLRYHLGKVRYRGTGTEIWDHSF